MRKTAWVLTGLLVVSAAAAMASEAPATDMSKDKGTTTTTTTMDKMEKKTAMKPAKSEKTAGELTAVDDAGKKATLKTKAGKEWSFTWDDKTVMSPKDAKLEVGGHVTVSHAKDSDLATKVAVAKAKMAKMDKKS